MTQMVFAELDLDSRLERAVHKMGFAAPTPIQAQAIPLIRTGVDVIARSQTGTGKTLAFAIPALEAIDTEENKPSAQVLVLCPTRELAQQVGEEVRKLALFLPEIRTAELFGGASMERQIVLLRRANFIIGTPGRVMDHMRRHTLKLANLKMLILDEADEMLKMGFKEDIETILSATPSQRQTVLFSATMPPLILALTKHFQNNPQLIEIDKRQVTIANIDQRFVVVPEGKKNEALNLLLHFYQPQRVLVFCNTKRMVDEVLEYLQAQGFAAESIHGDLRQSHRTQVMNSFKHGKVSILIATDVAARGIDVSGIDYVINYDIPLKTEEYVHRIGRTGRAGKSGYAISLCCGRRQISRMRGLAGEVKSKIVQHRLPTADQVRTRIVERNLEQLRSVLAEQEITEYVTFVERLQSEGYMAAQIAAAVLFLHCSGQMPDLPVLPAVQDEEKGVKTKSTAFKDIVLNVGTHQHVTPRHLIAAISERCSLSGREIGKIKIQSEQSIVGIRVAYVDRVLQRMPGCKICGQSVQTALATQTKSCKAEKDQQSVSQPKMAGKGRRRKK